MERTPRQCERALEEYDGEHGLTGLTRRLGEALAHLADAWTIADHHNSPGIVWAIASLLVCSPYVTEHRADLERFLVWDLGERQGEKLLAEVDLCCSVRAAMSHWPTRVPPHDMRGL